MYQGHGFGLNCLGGHIALVPCTGHQAMPTAPFTWFVENILCTRDMPFFALKKESGLYNVFLVCFATLWFNGSFKTQGSDNIKSKAGLSAQIGGDTTENKPVV